MVSHREAVEVIRDTIDRDNRIPDAMSYVIHEPDTEGAQANVSLPLIVFEILDTTRDDQNNSNFKEYVYNSKGQQVGRIFEEKWQMSLQMGIWTADGSDYNADELAATLRTVLYDYDVKGPDKTFQDDQGDPVPDIWNFTLEDTERADDLTQTPTIRRVRVSAQVYGAEQYRQDGLDTVQQVTTS